jgi:hypothetical protein
MREDVKYIIKLALKIKRTMKIKRILKNDKSKHYEQSKQ